MNDLEEIIQAIYIGVVVATFLYMTGRAQKAIELCKESLDLLSNKALEKEEQFGKFLCEAICKVMFAAYLRLSDKTNAIAYGRKLLAIDRECGKTVQEGKHSLELAAIYEIQNKYIEAKELYERAISIMNKTGNSKEEAHACAKLGTIFNSLGEIAKAKEYLERALAIAIEIGNREGEATCYANLGTVFKSLADYVKAKEYLEKALAIKIEIGDREGEATCYARLGTVFKSLADYVKAKEYLDKALAIAIEIDNIAEEASCYVNLGTVFISLADYVKAKEYLDKALAIAIEIGDREKEASCYLKLGAVLLSLGIKYADANKYFGEALLIATETGDRRCEAFCYNWLGNLFLRLGDDVKGKEYYEKALAINTEIGDRAGQAGNYVDLGSLFIHLDEYIKAEEYLEKALSICKEIDDFEIEFSCHEHLTKAKLTQEKNREAFPYLFESIQKCEDYRGFLKDNDEFKVLYSNVYKFPYKGLSTLFCDTGNPDKALYVEELGRARALSDLMVAQYCVERQISANPQSWIGIENVMEKERNCTCLYISYADRDVFLWILKTSGVIEFRRITVDQNTLHAKLATNLDAFFKNMALRQGMHEDDSRPSLTLFYKMIIAPVTDLLQGSEIIIVPDRNLHLVPFPALLDESGKYLSETFRIRIVPSLTTLKFIQDSPADYHSQTGALIVGDPQVGEVLWKGRRKIFPPLPCARKEAEMIGRLLCVQPLLGQQATKQAALQRIHSVSLVHFATHSAAARGEIVLAPVGTGSRLPIEKDCLLTMGDISQVQLRAKLVVLSCSHSARGQITVEGVVGMARAFLGSGARSVLVALWTLDDKATELFMSRFYEHLVRGESANESLHQAMKWMRGNGFAKISEWAPFMLIGDDVTFDFGNKRSEDLRNGGLQADDIKQAMT